MRKAWPWIVGIAVIALIGAVVLLGFGFLRTRSMPMYWGDARIRDWGDGLWHHPHMGFRFGIPAVGLLGLLLMIGLPLGFFGLIVAEIVLLVRALQNPATRSTELHKRYCENCGEPVQEYWQNCPYCGERLNERLTNNQAKED